MIGIYDKGSAQQVATGDPNTWDVLFPETLAGGYIADQSALRIDAWFKTVGAAGEAEVRINNRVIFKLLNIAGPEEFSLTVFRTGASSAIVRGSQNGTPIPETPITNGLNWAGQQAFEVRGKSAGEGGLILSQVGIAK